MARREDVRLADELGVDFVGMVFVAASPRAVTLQQAVALRKAAVHAQVVGVFDCDQPAPVNAAAEELNLDFVQLHGKPDLELCGQIVRPVIQAFRGVPDVETLERFLGCCRYVLLDKREGEDTLDLDVAAALPRSVLERTFLAGGLTSENVRPAVERIRPFAVDCARGIESSPGVKDREKTHLFLQRLTP
ncbi:MAG: phosphoribosylanthranilate isomerase [Thermoguttaceae bacterium]